MNGNVQERKFDLQGHRGCRGLMPENTIAAMLHALSLGVTTLEMDVVITKDGQVILSHEPYFGEEITTLPGGGFIQQCQAKQFNIYKMNYNEVLKYDVGLKPHPRFPEQQKIAAVKPLLKDVIDSVKAFVGRHHLPMPFFNIETKTSPGGDNVFHPQPEPFVDLLMGVIQDAGIEPQTIIQSFDFRTLQVVHQRYPGVQTAALVEDFDLLPFDGQLQKLGFTPTIYSPAYSLVTDSLVAACKKGNVKLIPWTVNDTAVARHLKGMGVDGLITDYPDKVK
jgi:glycerophosphoryl diester phosphodiesterase